MGWCGYGSKKTYKKAKKEANKEGKDCPYMGGDDDKDNGGGGNPYMSGMGGNEKPDNPDVDEPTNPWMPTDDASNNKKQSKKDKKNQKKDKKANKKAKKKQKKDRKMRAQMEKA